MEKRYIHGGINLSINKIIDGFAIKGGSETDF